MSKDPSKMNRAEWQQAARDSKARTIKRLQRSTGKSSRDAEKSWQKQAERLYRKRFGE